LLKSAVLVPVPLHKQRLKQRGFNQSLELCEAMSKLTDIRTNDCLDRSKKTWTQAQLPPDLRIDNVSGAFRLKEELSLADKIVIIVDDVATSGATLNEAARPLWEAGAKEVWGLTIARG